LIDVHGKNDFAERFKNFAGYRSENNFVGPSNNFIETLKIISKKF